MSSLGRLPLDLECHALLGLHVDRLLGNRYLALVPINSFLSAQFKFQYPQKYSQRPFSIFHCFTSKSLSGSLNLFRANSLHTLSNSSFEIPHWKAFRWISCSCKTYRKCGGCPGKNSSGPSCHHCQSSIQSTRSRLRLTGDLGQPLLGLILQCINSSCLVIFRCLFHDVRVDFIECREAFW